MINKYTTENAHKLIESQYSNGQSETSNSHHNATDKIELCLHILTSQEWIIKWAR